MRCGMFGSPRCAAMSGLVVRAWFMLRLGYAYGTGMVHVTTWVRLTLTLTLILALILARTLTHVRAGGMRMVHVTTRVQFT